ncbi:NRDE family protein [Pararhodonellum marinum]|uniref:NRDE family protein n=1 Tax=Pararhodonellum marinum TaxID=2755358 RepID=UPI00188F3E27|nr:NRDE family protein [Pararhodonellum marinum]
MCLVAFNWHNHSDFKFILSANRDEFFNRPSERLGLWPSGFYGGKDLKSGGTWLGIHPNGRFSFITNYRDLRQKINPKISRGQLVRDFLESKVDPLDYLKKVKNDKAQYEGFNLIVSDGEKLCYYSNHGKEVIELLPGMYGLSNGLLDVPWPKVKLAKKQMKTLLLQKTIRPDHLLGILGSKEQYPQDELPDTGLPKNEESVLSAQFILLGDNYGTVNSSALLIGHDGKVVFKERTFDHLKGNSEDKQIEFQQKQQTNPEL